MKNTNFEITYTDHSHEEVIVNRQKKHGYWKLKLVSLVLAFLIWLTTAVVTQSNQSQDDGEQESQDSEQEQSA